VQLEAWFKDACGMRPLAMIAYSSALAIGLLLWWSWSLEIPQYHFVCFARFALKHVLEKNIYIQQEMNNQLLVLSDFEFLNECRDVAL
jgi:hypothetical protein